MKDKRQNNGAPNHPLCATADMCIATFYQIAENLYNRRRRECIIIERGCHHKAIMRTEPQEQFALRSEHE